MKKSEFVAAGRGEGRPLTKKDTEKAIDADV